MENVAGALKMAFGFLVFVIAISLSISTFSNARQTIDSIISYRDKTQDYVYVTKANENNRTVGIESIIPAMYKAYSENYRIEFYIKHSQDGQEEKLILYKTRDTQYTQEWTNINYIDLEDEKFANENEAIEHLNTLLTNGKYTFTNIQGAKVTKTIASYKKVSSLGRTLYEETTDITNGLYNYFENKNFEERLGEYYQEDKSAGKESEELEINKTKKRVITYVMLDY